MKKAAIISVILIGILALGGGSAYAASQIAKSNAITQDAARNFAYIDAGILPEEANVLRTEFDYEKGTFVYEIEFIANGIYYEYSVDAASGRILEKEMEQGAPSLASFSSESVSEQNLPQNNSRGITEKPTESEAIDIIGIDKAKEIAVEDAGISIDDATFTEAHLEKDHGRTVYDIEFYTDRWNKYDYEIDAVSGLVLKRSHKEQSVGNNMGAPSSSLLNENSSTQNGQTTGAPVETDAVISIEDAKGIALSRSGLNAESVTFKKAKLEHEDGRLVYDIEFYIWGQTEYEYEIDAYTGTILDEDIEVWGD